MEAASLSRSVFLTQSHLRNECISRGAWRSETFISRPWLHVHVLGTKSSHLFRNVHLWNQIKPNSLCTALALTCTITHTLDCKFPSQNLLCSPYSDSGAVHLTAKATVSSSLAILLSFPYGPDYHFCSLAEIVSCSKFTVFVAQNSLWTNYHFQSTVFSSALTLV